MPEHQKSMNHEDEFQKIKQILLRSFDEIDEEEPMCDEARDIFRNDTLPLALQLLNAFIGHDDLDEAHTLFELIDSFGAFIVWNGPASATSGELLQRYELNKRKRGWHADRSLKRKRNLSDSGVKEAHLSSHPPK